MSTALQEALPPLWELTDLQADAFYHALARKDNVFLAGLCTSDPDVTLALHAALVRCAAANGECVAVICTDPVAFTAALGPNSRRIHVHGANSLARDVIGRHRDKTVLAHRTLIFWQDCAGGARERSQILGKLPLDARLVLGLSLPYLKFVGWATAVREDLMLFLRNAYATPRGRWAHVLGDDNPDAALRALTHAMEVSF